MLERKKINVIHAYKCHFLLSSPSIILTLIFIFLSLALTPIVSPFAFGKFPNFLFG